MTNLRALKWIEWCHRLHQVTGGLSRAAGTVTSKQRTELTRELVRVVKEIDDEANWQILEHRS